ncbi:MAG: hypothetical protein ACKVOW_10130 [Chitinophagaceae bacterium]
MKNQFPDHRVVIVPLVGFCLFVLLYLIATGYYPGGSNNDPSTLYFSWQHNYWCDLLETTSKNGLVNTARPVAISALFVLGCSIGLFFYFFSALVTSKWRFPIRYCGILSIVPMLLLFIGPHDLLINFSALLALIAIACALLVLYKDGAYSAFYLGTLCIILCVLNNYIYYNNHLLFLLPVVQKISFLIFLFWFTYVEWILYKKVCNQKLFNGKARHEP